MEVDEEVNHELGSTSGTNTSSMSSSIEALNWSDFENDDDKENDEDLIESKIETDTMQESLCEDGFMSLSTSSVIANNVTTDSSSESIQNAENNKNEIMSTSITSLASECSSAGETLQGDMASNAPVLDDGPIWAKGRKKYRFEENAVINRKLTFGVLISVVLAVGLGLGNLVAYNECEAEFKKPQQLPTPSCLNDQKNNVAQPPPLPKTQNFIQNQDELSRVLQKLEELSRKIDSFQNATREADENVLSKNEFQKLPKKSSIHQLISQLIKLGERNNFKDESDGEVESKKYYENDVKYIPQLKAGENSKISESKNDPIEKVQNNEKMTLQNHEIPKEMKILEVIPKNQENKNIPAIEATSENTQNKEKTQVLTQNQKSPEKENISISKSSLEKQKSKELKVQDDSIKTGNKNYKNLKVKKQHKNDSRAEKVKKQDKGEHDKIKRARKLERQLNFDDDYQNSAKFYKEKAKIPKNFKNTKIKKEDWQIKRAAHREKNRSGQRIEFKNKNMEKKSNWYLERDKIREKIRSSTK